LRAGFGWREYGEAKTGKPMGKRGIAGGCVARGSASDDRAPARGDRSVPSRDVSGELQSELVRADVQAGCGPKGGEGVRIPRPG